MSRAGRHLRDATEYSAALMALMAVDYHIDGFYTPYAAAPWYDGHSSIKASRVSAIGHDGALIFRDIYDK